LSRELIIILNITEAALLSALEVTESILSHWNLLRTTSGCAVVVVQVSFTAKSECTLKKERECCGQDSEQYPNHHIIFCLCYKGCEWFVIVSILLLAGSSKQKNVCYVNSIAYRAVGVC
jgi:hypothetical protein